MANKKLIIILAVCLCLASTLVPPLVALNISKNQSEKAELERITGYAKEVFRLTRQTKHQLDNLYNAFAENPNPSCTPENIKLMARQHMTSSMIQDVVAMSQNRITCSSHGFIEPQLLGTPDGVNRDGIRSLLDIDLINDGKQRFNVYEKNGVAAIVPTNQVVDIYANEKELVLAAALIQPKIVLRHRGAFSESWLDHYIATGETRFIDEDYWVVVNHQQPGVMLTFAALPVALVSSGLSQMAYVLLPLSFLIGIGLSVMIILAARQRISIEADIRNALKRHEFFMVYQPVVNLQTGVIKGVEALIRWRDTDGNLISPDSFIPIAEQRGIMTAITTRVFELVAEDFRAVWQQHPHFSVAINLSAMDLENHNTVLLVSEFIQKTNALPGSVVLEATERGFVDAQQARSVIHALRALGAKVAVDDFGTGYSSLSYLETLDLDCLKIDKSFIETLDKESATSTVALHIIEMGKSMELTMIAEGVETAAQVAELRKRGVHCAQGWYFGKPMEIDLLLGQLKQMPVADKACC